MDNSNKKLDALTKKDLRYIVKGSFKTGYIQEYLSETAENIFYANKTYSGTFYKNLICVSLEKFLQDSNFAVLKTLGLGDDDFHALKKEDIEVSPGKFIRCVTGGMFLIETRDSVTTRRFILEFEHSFFREDSWDLSLYYSNKDEQFALKFIDDLDRYATKNNYLRGKKINPELSHIILDKHYTWDDVILPSSVKELIDTNVSNLLNNSEILRDNGMVIKRGLILKGVPGTGKTLIGKILCSQVNCSFLWVTPKYLNNAGSVSMICNLAREISPTILFLEDIDLYAGSRESSASNSLLGELMNQLDGLVSNEFVVTIATTNNVEAVENAIRNRPGRFDRIIEVPKPDYYCRIRMLKFYTSKSDFSSLNFSRLSELSDGLTGAHMRELVTTAMIYAAEDKCHSNGKLVLSDEHFERSLGIVKEKQIGQIGFKSKAHDSDIEDLED